MTLRDDVKLLLQRALAGGDQTERPRAPRLIWSRMTTADIRLTGRLVAAGLPPPAQAIWEMSVPASIGAADHGPFVQMFPSGAGHTADGGEHRLQAEDDGGMGRMGTALPHHLQGIADADRDRPGVEQRLPARHGTTRRRVWMTKAVARLSRPHTTNCTPARRMGATRFES